MLVIDHLECAVRDDNAVSGSEALFYPAGEVHTLLDKDYWISTGSLGGLDLLQHVFDIAGGSIIHLLGIPLEAVSRIVGRHTERDF